MTTAHHCICGAIEFDPVRLEHLGDPPYELPVMVCGGCGLVYVVADAHRAERHRLHLAEAHRIQEGDEPRPPPEGRRER